MPSSSSRLGKLPGTSHLAAIRLLDEDGEILATIENRPGSQLSLAIYNHLAQTFGAITPEAARKGLELYGECVDEARASPGKHPNVDRLLEIAEQRPRTLRAKHVFAL